MPTTFVVLAHDTFLNALHIGKDVDGERVCCITIDRCDFEILHIALVETEFTLFADDELEYKAAAQYLRDQGLMYIHPSDRDQDLPDQVLFATDDGVHLWNALIDYKESHQ